KGLGSGFQLYFLVPLLLSWQFLWVEGADRSKPSRRLFAVVAPLALLALALPGPSVSLTQEVYLQLLQGPVGSPIPITAALLIGYFAYLGWRRVRLAEIGLLAVLGVMTFVDRHTIDLHTLSSMNAAPIIAAVVVLVTGSVWLGSALRMGIASMIVIASLCYT